jgi:SAM-dependent methyltransferase
MHDWEERLTAASQPELQLEHAVRYQAAAPIALAGEVWCDLGCGTGVAAARALAGFAGKAVLVDVSAKAVADAAAQVNAPTVAEVVADLSTPEGLAAVRAALLPAEDGCFTCFEVVEHLPTFVPLVELLVAFARDHGFTSVLSVPNDAFWTIENPYHLSRWGEGAFAELVSVLPDDHVIAHQTALSGSCITRTGGRVTVEAEVARERVPTQFLVAFGPRAHALGSPAALAVSDLDAHRTWERQREADLAYYQALAARATA